MRRLMWFSIGFAAACGMAIWLLPDGLILLGVILFSLLLGVSAFFKKYPYIRCLSTVFLGCIVGFLWFAVYQAWYLNPAKLTDGRTMNTVITAADYSYDTQYGVGADGNVVISGKPYKVRFYVNEEIPLAPGDQITGEFAFRFTVTTEESEGTYHSGNGIFLLAYVRGAYTHIPAVEVPVKYFPAVLARRISDIIFECFPEDTVAFAKALLLGDTSGLSYEVDTALKISGIRHVVAVSGLHISILFSLIYMLTLKNRFLSAMVSGPVLLLFAALAGFTPSVTRACIMSLVMILGRLADREYDGATSLSFAALLMIALNPMVLTSVGFQLSVASVAGIFLFNGPIHSWILNKLGNPTYKSTKGKWLIRAASSVSVSVSATVMTAPLSAVYFGTISIVGILTNLLTLWVISFVFYGIMAVCLLSLAWGAGAHFLAGLVSIPIRYVLLCAKVLARFPIAAVYTQSIYIVLWLIACYLLLLILFAKKKHLPFIAGGIVLGLGAALFLSWLLPLTHDVTMTVLDVGQGQSILLQSDGKTVLVDCGGDSDTQTADTVSQMLLSQGITCIDAAIITHCDRDHIGALAHLLTRMEIRKIIMPEDERQFGFSNSENIFLAREDMILSFGETQLQIFTSHNKDSGNENGLCVLFERESCAILITGDRNILGERLLMKRTQLPQVDILVAGHHGAADSTGDQLLQVVQPEIVVISVGQDNSYGHPAQPLLQRLKEYGCEVLRTDLNGTITIRR